jgi:hypothetical protein
VKSEDDPRYFDGDGSFRPGSLDPRTDLYVGRMRGSANEAFAKGSFEDDPKAEFVWQLGSEDSCEDCPEKAADSPYTEDTLYSYPGDGDTECLGNCKCILVRQDGATGFGHHGDDDEEDAADSDPTGRTELYGSAGAKLTTDYTSAGQKAYEAAKNEGIDWAKGNAPDSSWQQVYEATQKEFADAEIDELTVYRGFKVDKDSEYGRIFADAKSGDTATLADDLDFASFTTKKATGTNYANSNLKTSQLGVTIRRIIKKEDVVASYHLDKGMKTEREVIGKSKEPVEVEVVQVNDRVKAKKKPKSEFGSGRYLGVIRGLDLNGRMNPPTE